MVKFYRAIIFVFITTIFFHSANAANTVVTPAPDINNMCVGGSFSTVGTIIIAETNFYDFSAGSSLTYILSAPNNFQFNPGATPTVTTNAGSGITNIVVSAPTTSTLTITFDISGPSMGAGPLDSLKITGLQVKAISAPSSGNIKKTGGSSYMQGNTPADNVSHCLLTSVGGPAITSQPINKSVCTGGTNVALFSVTATGATSYSWFRDNNDNSDGSGFDEIATTVSSFYGGYTTANLSSNTINIAQNGFLFRVEVSNACGTTISNTVTLSTADPAAITTQPSTGSEACVGGTKTFTIIASSATSYKWQENSGSGFVDISNTAPYSNVTTASLTISGSSMTSAFDNRTYRCLASNATCATPATSNSATLTLTTLPVISAQPGNKVTCLGNDPTFSITASALGSFTYSWERDKNDGAGFSVPPSPPYYGLNTNTITIDNVSLGQNGYLFNCTLSNVCGTVVSNNATLTVYSSGASIDFFGLESSYCINGGKDTLQGFPAGGVFSGAGMGATNASTGKAAFNPYSAGSGSKSITYTYGCAVSKNTTVKDTLNIKFTSPANNPANFTNADPPLNLTVEAVSTSGALAGTFAGAGVTGNQFKPLDAGIGNFPVSFTYTNSNGCISKVTNIMQVTSPGLGIPALLKGSPYCQGTNTAIKLTIDSVQGGMPYFLSPSYSSMLISLYGSYCSTYGAPYCDYYNAYYAAGKVYEYDYSGKGITDNGDGTYTFRPDSAGSYTIQYRYRNTYNGVITVYAQQTITVRAKTNLSLDGLLPNVCNINPSFDMTPGPAFVTGAPGTSISVISPVSAPAGVLSGPSNNIFNPSVANSGNFTVRYHFVAANGCANDFDKTITVFAKPAVPALDNSLPGYGVQNEKFCYGEARKNLKVPNSILTTYNWYSSPLLSAPSLVETGTILSPFPSDNQPGTYHYYVTKTISGCTSDPLDVTFTVNDGATVDAGSDQTICSGSTVSLAGTSKKVVSGNSLGATWSTSTGGSFNNATNLSAIYTPSKADSAQGYVVLTLTSDDPDGSGPCLASIEDVKIGINRAAKVYAGSDKTYCSNQPITLEATVLGNPSPISWSGGTSSFGSPNLSTTSYTPSNNEKSGGTIVFTATGADPDGTGPCVAVTDNVSITINQEAKVFAGVDQAICKAASGNTIIQLNGTSSLAFSGNALDASWSGGLGVFSDSDNLNSTYKAGSSEIPANGSVFNSVRLYLTTIDPDGSGGPCQAVKDSVDIRINPLPRIDSVIVKTHVCTSEPPLPIRAVYESKYKGNSTETYQDLDFGGLGVSGSNFVPGNATPGDHTVRYTNIDGNGCVNYRDTIVSVYGTPTPRFIITKLCAELPTLFNGGNSTLPVEDTRSSMNSYFWNFGNTSTENDTSRSINPLAAYTYTKTSDESAKRDYLVKLKIGTDKGCYAEKDTLITIGNIPVADFKWSHICPSDPTTDFVDISRFPSNEVEKYKWYFADGTDTLLGQGMLNTIDTNLAVKHPKHKMANGRGAYDVRFIINTVRGCSDTMSHIVNILDEFQPTSTNPYVKTFVSDPEYWAVDGQNPSWQYGVASKSNINTGTRNVWVTNASGTYNENEKSYLNGPCLNFTELERPMVALKLWSATEPKFAGTALQYSTDGGSTWNLAGSDQTGVNWYNNFGIFGNPGNQQLNQFGWSGYDGGWKVARMALNDLAKFSAGGSPQTVRIRLAFGSGLGDKNLKDGFALDSIWVGERDKILLVESFTNAKSGSVVLHDKKIDSIINISSKDVKAIQYHTAFYSPDLINLNNQSDPSSRVLVYGVPSIPYYVMDGNYSNGKVVTDSEKQKLLRDIDKRSLDRAKFSIGLSTVITGSSVSVNAKVTAKEAMANDIIVQIAVVEREVNTVAGNNGQSHFEWVLSRMLPNAAGTFYDKDFNKNDFIELNQAWDYWPSEVFDPSQLGVVVFVQDAVTKEVYQTSYQFQTGVTALKNEKLMSKKVNVYPNPTRDIANFEFEAATESDIAYTVANELGQVVLQGNVESGSDRFVISTDNLPQGMYVVRIGSEKEGFVFKKVVVSR